MVVSYYKSRQIYYKLRQNSIQITAALLQITTVYYYKLRYLYYKLRRNVITNYCSFITNYDNLLLQITATLGVITHYGSILLQITAGITNCDIITNYVVTDTVTEIIKTKKQLWILKMN